MSQDKPKQLIVIDEASPYPPTDQSAKPAREWWIIDFMAVKTPGGNYRYEAFDYRLTSDTAIHVIEYSAFEAMRKERNDLYDLIHDEDGWMASCKHLEKERDEWKRQLDNCWEDRGSHWKNEYAKACGQRDQLKAELDEWKTCAETRLEMVENMQRADDTLRAELAALKLNRDIETMANTKSVYSGTHVMELYEAERARGEKLEIDLKKAIRYLREGKAKFAPNTTNSFVDELLKEYEQGEKGEK